MPNDNPKWFFLSKGFMGPAVALVCIALGAAGFDLDADLLTETLLSVIAGISSILGMFGRTTAKRELKFK